MLWSLFWRRYKQIGLPTWLSGKESTCQCRRCRFDPWVGKIPWRRKWQPALVFLPGETHEQRSLVGYSPWGRKNQTQLSDHTHTHKLHMEHRRNCLWILQPYLVMAFKCRCWRSETQMNKQSRLSGRGTTLSERGMEVRVAHLGAWR